MALDPELAARLKRNAEGLFCAVAQEKGTGEVPVSYTHLTLPTNREV